MRKVTATCIYTSRWENGHKTAFQCWNFTVNHNGNNITLVQYLPAQKPYPYEYADFNDLYRFLINTLKNNGYYTQVTSQFGRDFYNIQFIELGMPVISKFGYLKKED